MSLFIAGCAGLGACLGALGWRYLFEEARCTGPAKAAEAALCIGLSAAAPFWAAGPVGLAGPLGGQGAALHVLATLWIWTALALALCDARVRRLPDPLTAALAVLALGSVWLDPARGLGSALLAAALGVGAFGALHAAYLARTGRVGIGLGDIKLIAGIAAMVGPWHLPMVTLVAALAAGLISLALAYMRGQKSLSQLELPFGLYLCGAAIWVWGIS